MAYCQSLVKLKKDSHWVSASQRIPPLCLFFSCFKSCSIYPHLLHVIVLSDTVCWPGCVSKCDNASQHGFADESQKVFPGKICEPAEARALRRQGGCFLHCGEWAYLSCYFPTLGGWMLLPVPDSASSRMDVNSDSRRFLLLRCECICYQALSVVVSSKSSSKCLCAIKL